MNDDETYTHETPVLVRIWHEGRRVFEDSVITAECDGDTVTVWTDKGEESFDVDEWDELTVEYT